MQQRCSSNALKYWCALRRQDCPLDRAVWLAPKVKSHHLPPSAVGHLHAPVVFQDAAESTIIVDVLSSETIMATVLNGTTSQPKNDKTKRSPGMFAGLAPCVPAPADAVPAPISILYVGHIVHGFFFGQFARLLHLRRRPSRPPAPPRCPVPRSIIRRGLRSMCGLGKPEPAQTPTKKPHSPLSPALAGRSSRGHHLCFASSCKVPGARPAVEPRAASGTRVQSDDVECSVINLHVHCVHTVGLPAPPSRPSL